MRKDKYLVIQEVGDIARVKIVDYGTEMTRPCVYWKIRNDEVRMLVNTKINSAIKKYVVGGVFESPYGCLVGLTYEKVQDIFISILGPDDEREKSYIKDRRTMHMAETSGLILGTLYGLTKTMLKLAFLLIMIPLKILTYALLIFHVIK